LAYPFSISLGVAWNLWTNRKSRRAVEYRQNRHITIFGPTRSGKGVSLEIPNLLRLKGLSIISIDPKGQNAAVTARWRRTVSDVVFLNPFDLHGLGDAGFNPLAWVQSYEDAAAGAEALPQVKSHEPFFPESAQGLLAGIILAEVREAAAQNRVPTLENVRRILTGDLVAFADAMSKSGDFQVATLVASFVKENRTLDAIKKPADTATKWLLSEPISRSLSVPQGIDFAALKGPRPLTVYVILDTDKLESFAPWLRLVVVCALRALYRQGGKGLRTLFMLSEAASFGKLEPLATAMTQGAGFGIQLMQVWQDINQARAIFGRDQSNTFLGMSGATFAFAPNDPETAEWMSIRSGEI